MVLQTVTKNGRRSNARASAARARAPALFNRVSETRPRQLQALVMPPRAHQSGYW